MIDPLAGKAALARWLAHGATSLTHPFLRHALEACFHPLGIEADWLEAEPLGAWDSTLGGCWLRGGRWNPARLDPRHPAALDFGPWRTCPQLVAVEPSGALRLASGPCADIAPADADQTWRAVRHSVRAAQTAASFIHAAAGLLLAGDQLAELYAAGEDAKFAAAVWLRLERAASEPAHASDLRAAETIDHRDNL